MNFASFILHYYTKLTNLNKEENKKFIFAVRKIKKNFRNPVEKGRIVTNL